MKPFYFFLASCLFLCSCKPITTLKKMNSKNATYEAWTNGTGKSVVFIPMVHAGKAEFYEDVKSLISKYKSEGYIVFYEGIKRNFNESLGEDSTLRGKYIGYAKTTRFHSMNFENTDSIDRLVCLLKLKRFAGIIPDSASYIKALQRSSLTKKAVFQPRGSSLGISETDLNVDVSMASMVDEYERQFGTIGLEQIDFAYAINDQLPASRRLKKKRTQKIIIDYRDKNLSETIQAASNQKIVVIYGLGHMKGTFKELKNADQSWKISGH